MNFVSMDYRLFIVNAITTLVAVFQVQNENKISHDGIVFFVK